MLVDNREILRNLMQREKEKRGNPPSLNARAV